MEKLASVRIQRWFIALRWRKIFFYDESASQEEMSSEYIHKYHKGKLFWEYGVIQKTKINIATQFKTFTSQL